MEDAKMQTLEAQDLREYKYISWQFVESLEEASYFDPNYPASPNNWFGRITTADYSIDFLGDRYSKTEFMHLLDNRELLVHSATLTSVNYAGAIARPGARLDFTRGGERKSLDLKLTHQLLRNGTKWLIQNTTITI